MAEQRALVVKLIRCNVICQLSLKEPIKTFEPETLQLCASTDFGAPLLNGFADGTCLKAKLWRLSAIK